MKKQRRFYCDDEELKLLQEKAQEHFTGQGFLSKYLRKLARAKTILVVEGKGNIKISMK